jgi:hypothetical protein
MREELASGHINRDRIPVALLATDEPMLVQNFCTSQGEHSAGGYWGHIKAIAFPLSFLDPATEKTPS